MMGPSGVSAGSQNISGHTLKSVPQYTPQQLNLFQSLLGSVGNNASGASNFLGKLASGDEGSFEQMEAPAYAAFNKSLGQIGSRFSQLGAQDSSAFQNAVSGAGANLAQNLQSQRSGIQNDAISRLLGLSQNLLGQKPFENILEKDFDLAEHIFPMFAQIFQSLLSGGAMGIGNSALSNAWQTGLGGSMGTNSPNLSNTLRV